MGVAREPGRGRMERGREVCGLWVGAAPLRWMKTFCWVRLGDEVEGARGGHGVVETLLCHMSTTFRASMAVLAARICSSGVGGVDVLVPSSQASSPGSRQERKRSAIKSRLRDAPIEDCGVSISPLG